MDEKTRKAAQDAMIFNNLSPDEVIDKFNLSPGEIHECWTEDFTRRYVDQVNKEIEAKKRQLREIQDAKNN